MKDMSSGERRDIKADEDFRLKGYLRKLKTLLFIYHCHFFTDVLQHIAKLSLVFQSDDTAIHQVVDQMVAITDLLLLKNVDGGNLKLFKQKVKIAEPSSNTCDYERVELKPSGQSVQLYDDNRKAYIDSVIGFIEKRYDKIFKTRSRLFC